MSPEHRGAWWDLGSVLLASAATKLGACALAAGLLACTPLSWSSDDAGARFDDDVAIERAEPPHAAQADATSATDEPATRASRDEAPTGTTGTAAPASAAREEPARPAEAAAKKGGDARPAPAPPSDAASAESEPEDADELRLPRGDGLLPLLVPRGEELLFEVEIDLGALGEPTVGTVTLSSGVDAYVEGLPSKGRSAMGASSKKRGLDVGWIKSVARGKHLGYELDHELYVRHLPQVWPHVLFTDTQRGSENRRRRMKIGVQDERLVCTYEHDGHCKGCELREHFVESKWLWGKPYHCEKCKRMEHRLWREPVTRDVPQGALDMLSAVYLARAMVRDGLTDARFPLIDKQTLWQVDLTLGPKKRITVPAGRFECVEVRLVTSVPRGEKSPGEGFQGLFGIQGSIRMWFEAASGVPVLISGTLPVPVLGDLDVRVELARFSGTPDAFVARK